MEQDLVEVRELKQLFCTSRVDVMKWPVSVCQTSLQVSLTSLCPLLEAS